jgi:two-component system sensor histidine kinase UhpB
MRQQAYPPSGELQITTPTRPASSSSESHPTVSFTRPVETLRDYWYGLPVRWQLMISISVISIGAVLLSIILAVVDARGRVEVEVSSSMEVAHQLVTDAIRRSDSKGTGKSLMELIPEQLTSVRHARILISSDGGDLVQVAPDTRTNDLVHHPESAPQWFADLVGPSVGTRQIRVMLGNDRMGSVLIVGEPRDELGEVWEEVSRRAVIWLAITALMLAFLYFVLGRLLNPLVELSAGMHQLEDGHYGARVVPPPVREIGALASQFNLLAEALEKSRDENTRLYRSLIGIQEDERRRIANDLHDEAGPCLFGITANAASIARLAVLEPNGQTEPIKTRVDEIHTITERLKAINRDLLRNLRPVEIGRIPLTELVGSLVAGFERRHPECAFKLSFGKVERGYGEEADITIFRCVQEGLTNVMKHANATKATIEIGELAEANVLRVVIKDNGRGLPDDIIVGIGTTAMRERVRSISGSSSIESTPDGTTLSIEIPTRRGNVSKANVTDQAKEATT